MKNKILFILIAFVFVAMYSCDKKLDTKPTGSIDINDVFKTSDDVIGALKGCYDDLGDGDFYGGQLFVGADLLGDSNELNWSGTYEQFTQIHNKTIPVTNSFVANTWLAGYKVINDANNVLAHLDIVVATDKDRVEGEAKFIRGSAYFELVRMYAKAWNDGDPNANAGVPVVLTPTDLITDENKVSRNTVAEVYAQAITDLKDATQKCITTDNSYIFATNIAAYAMLARVYLQQQDYANALQAENSALTLALKNDYHLTSTYAAAFPSADPPTYIANTPEDIFTMQVNATSGVNNFNTYYSENQRGDIQITDEHFALYEPKDDRLNLFDGEYTLKFENYYGSVRLIRLAELYLTRAECNFRLGSSVGAAPVDDINTIRARVKLKPYNAGGLTLDNIILERELELAFEGFRLHDEKRLEKNVGNLWPWNSPKLIYPIPQREIYANPNLTQNEGY